MDRFHVDDLPAHIEDEFHAGLLPIRLHTPECDAQMTAQEAVYEAWEARYGVTCCKFCHMSGLEDSVHFDEPPIKCWACTGQGRCPQCGWAFDIDAEERCSACGWSEAVCKPDPPFCSCWSDGLSDEEIGEPPF
jgi:hypothetical protein